MSVLLACAGDRKSEGHHQRAGGASDAADGDQHVQGAARPGPASRRRRWRQRRRHGQRVGAANSPEACGHRRVDGATGVRLMIVVLGDADRIFNQERHSHLWPCENCVLETVPTES